MQHSVIAQIFFLLVAFSFGIALYTFLLPPPTGAPEMPCIISDSDGDGIPSISCDGSDCNDEDASVYPGANELCDGKDNSCDGLIDEGCPLITPTPSRFPTPYPATTTPHIPPRSNLPDSPSNLTVSNISYNKVTLRWRDNASNETGFLVEKKIESGSFSPWRAFSRNSIAANDNTVRPNQHYSYRVSAFNSYGYSSYSNTVEVNIPPLPSPKAEPTPTPPPDSSPSPSPTPTPSVEPSPSTTPTPSPTPTPTPSPSPSPSPTPSQTPTPTPPPHAYLELESDITVTGHTKLLETVIVLTQTNTILVSSTGSIYPAPPSPSSAGGSASIMIDGNTVSNWGIIDWSSSSGPAEHSFNALGAVQLGAGQHTITLTANTLPGRTAFKVRSGSNLIVFADPANTVATAKLYSDSEVFNFDIDDECASWNTLPHTPVAKVTMIAPNDGDLIALASGRSYLSGNNYGDAMWGIYLDGAPLLDSSSWTVNDIWTGAETHAPMFQHAFLRGLTSQQHVVSLDATEFPWCAQPEENTGQYRIGGTTKLVVLSGGMNVKGRGTLLGGGCLGSSDNPPPQWCPSVGTNVTIATGTFTIPASHDGVVMFSGMVRVQGNRNDAGYNGGTVYLWLELDGKQVGSIGRQEITSGAIESQRTTAASYLSAGSGRLAPGTHTVRLMARVEGSFERVFLYNNDYNKDLPLIWFD